MIDLLEKVKGIADRCNCGQHYPIAIEKVDNSSGSLERAITFMLEKGWNEVGLVTDDVIYSHYGDMFSSLITEAGIKVIPCLIKPNEHGDVIADEHSIVQVMVDLPLAIHAYIVLGAGTLHDIVRFVASRVNKPFLSIPTAPSVDGFTSSGAPILLRGFKQTIPTKAPIAVFADPNVYGKAPQALVAAGFGDMIGKHTSLFDWKYSHLVGGEQYCRAVAELTEEALHSCESAYLDIAAGEEKGIHVLMDALLLSGLSMLLFGASHPASGAEHHLSHDWEMELLRNGSRQLLHGAKVGVACALIAEKYTEWAQEVYVLDIPELMEALNKIPSATSIRRRLGEVGGPTTPEELGIQTELVDSSLLRAHHHRANRYTFLKSHNEKVNTNEV